MSQETDRDSGGGGEGHALLESLISEGKGRKDQVTKQEASFKKAASVRKSSLTEQEVTCVTLPVDRLHKGGISVERSLQGEGVVLGGTELELWAKGCNSDDRGAI